MGPRSAGHECRPRHEVDAGHRNPSPSAPRKSGAFLVLFWHAKENIALEGKSIYPAHRREYLLENGFRKC